MADDVSITFSAQIGQLISGVDQIKSTIGSLVSTVEGLGGAFGSAFSVDKIAGFINTYAKLGSEIEGGAAMLGASTKDFQEFGVIAKATGLDAGGIAAAMERFQVSLQHALVPTSQQALALKALGLSARQLIGLPLPEQINKFADAVSKFADGPGKTAAVGALNRGFVQMIPLLDQGSAGLNQLREAADNSGAVMSAQTVKSLSDLDRSLALLKVAVSGAAGSLVGEMAPALTRVTSGMTLLISNMNVAVKSNTLWEQEIIGLTTATNELLQVFANLGEMVKTVFSFKWGDVDANWAKLGASRAAGLDKVAAIQQEGEDKINAIAKRAAAQLQATLAGEGSSGGKPQVPALDENAAGAAKAQAEQYQAMIEQAKGAYAVLKEQYSTDAAVHKITVDQETAALSAALDERWAIEQALFAKELTLYAEGSPQYNAVLKQQMAAYQGYAKEHVGLTSTMLKADVSEWQSVLSPVMSAWNSQLRGLLSGTETWSTAMKKIVGDLVIQIIEKFEQLAVEKAALGLASMTSGITGGAGGGPMSLLGSLTGSGGSPALTAAGTTLETAGVSLNTAAVALNGAAAALSAGGAAGGVGSPLSLLPAVAAFAGGTDYMVRGGLAMLHEGETVIPAARGSGDFTGAGMGGDVHIHSSPIFNISAIDRRSVDQFFSDNKKPLLKAIRDATRHGAHLGLRQSGSY